MQPSGVAARAPGTPRTAARGARASCASSPKPIGQEFVAHREQARRLRGRRWPRPAARRGSSASTCAALRLRASSDHSRGEKGASAAQRLAPNWRTGVCTVYPPASSTRSRRSAFDLREVIAERVDEQHDFAASCRGRRAWPIRYRPAQERRAPCAAASAAADSRASDRKGARHPESGRAGCAIHGDATQGIGA